MVSTTGLGHGREPALSQTMSGLWVQWRMLLVLALISVKIICLSLLLDKLFHHLKMLSNSTTYILGRLASVLGETRIRMVL
uniref:Uncharacterized protein n=1 Tax=Arundo donax TaxID=35708 RepID=A0A0A9F2R3_ARUDO